MFVQSLMWIVGFGLIFASLMGLYKIGMKIFYPKSAKEAAEKSLEEKLHILELRKLDLEIKRADLKMSEENLKVEGEIKKLEKTIQKVKSKMSHLKGESKDGT